MVVSVYVARGYYGEVLYVGCTQNLRQRLSQHRCNSKWGRRMCSYDAREYPTKRRALRVEARAIRLLKPIFNITVRKKHADIEADKLERIKAFWLDPLLSERDRIQQCSAIAGRNLTRGWLHGRFPRSQHNRSGQINEALWWMDGDRYIGVDLARDGGTITECEFRRLPDGTLEVLDIRETPLPPINDKEQG